MKVEAEGQELVLRSEQGGIAIIPKHLREDVDSLLLSDSKESNDALNSIIGALPTNENYAEDGSLYAGMKYKIPGADRVWASVEGKNNIKAAKGVFIKNLSDIGTNTWTIIEEPSKIKAKYGAYIKATK